MTSQRRNGEPLKYVAEWIDKDGNVYHTWEFEADHYSDALQAAREYSANSDSLLHESDLVVSRR